MREETFIAESARQTDDVSFEVDSRPEINARLFKVRITSQKDFCLLTVQERNRDNMQQNRCALREDTYVKHKYELVFIVIGPGSISFCQPLFRLHT